MSHAQPAPMPGGQQRPAPTTPIAQYLAEVPRPGVSVDGRYLVLPRIVLDQLPLSVQQELVQRLTAVHTLGSRAPWPAGYHVTAARWEPIGEMTESSLREIGVVAELDLEGELVYRDSTGRKLTAEDLERPAPVSCPDPLYAHLDQPRRQPS